MGPCQLDHSQLSLLLSLVLVLSLCCPSVRPSVCLCTCLCVCIYTKPSCLLDVRLSIKINGELCLSLIYPEGFVRKKVQDEKSYQILISFLFSLALMNFREVREEIHVHEGRQLQLSTFCVYRCLKLIKEKSVKYLPITLFVIKFSLFDSLQLSYSLMPEARALRESELNSRK